MNEELQHKLVEILTGIQSAVKATSDFAMAQLPDIAQSYVAYGRAWTVFVAIAAAITTVVAFKYALKWLAESDGASIMVVAFVGLPAALVSAFHIKAAMLVWFAPKVWLLQELATLVK